MYGFPRRRHTSIARHPNYYFWPFRWSGCVFATNAHRGAVVNAGSVVSLTDFSATQAHLTANTTGMVVVAGQSPWGAGVRIDGRYLYNVVAPVVGANPRSVVLAYTNWTNVGEFYQHLLHWGNAATSQAYGVVVCYGRLGNHTWYDAYGTPLSMPTASVVVLTYNGSEENFYSNAMLVGQRSAGLNTGSGGLLLGSRIAPYAERATYTMHEVAIYNRVLTGTEIDEMTRQLRMQYGI